MWSRWSLLSLWVSGLKESQVSQWCSIVPGLFDEETSCKIDVNLKVTRSSFRACSVCACSTPQQIELFSWTLSLWLTVSSSLPDVMLDSVCFTQRTNIKNSGLPNSFTDAVKEFKCFIELPGWEEKKPSFSMTLCNSSSPLNPFITTYYHWQIQITVRTHNKSLTRIWNWRLEHFFVFFSDLLWENFCSQFIWQHEPIVHLYYIISYIDT